MKIYVVAHENIVYPKEYRKIEITEEDVEGYIKRSVAYEDMLETLPDMSSNAPMDEEEEFYKLGYYDLGDFYLALER